MRRIVFFVPVLLLATLPVAAQNTGPQYKIELNQQSRVLKTTRERGGKQALFVTVQFKIKRPDGELATDVNKDEIVVEEDGRRVAELEIHQPSALEVLTTVLALDTSGSMADHGKIEEAKRAARLFLDRLNPKSDCGLILFDHEMRTVEPPVRDLERTAAHRRRLAELIDATTPRGGTAYLDATVEAIRQLRGIRGRKAVLLMTDGVDLNSKNTLADVIRVAQAAEVPVYTLGVGEPGRNEPVTTVLVLDRSGSMADPADATDNISKIKALHRAGGRFVDLMRPGAKTSLLSFSNKPDTPGPFSDDKAALKKGIESLQAKGDTALFDATLDAIATLEAAHREGKRAVVVMTDGIDNRSRRRVGEVIDRARRAEIPLHMLGLGQQDEIDEPVMMRMAQETGGTYHRAGNQKALYEVFENLSIQLHDDGIDEASLRQIADETGGKYYPARDVTKLSFIYGELAEELQTTYTVTFPSSRSSHDGTARGIDISVWRNGARLSDVASVDYNVHGVIVPEMDARVYLVLLSVLGGLLLVPAGLRRLYRFYGGA
jgi:VWFA-related protein